MTKNIRVTVKNVYGNDTIYPVDFVNELGALTRRKTLDARDLQALRNMGFTIERVDAPAALPGAPRAAALVDVRDGLNDAGKIYLEPVNE